MIAIGGLMLVSGLVLAFGDMAMNGTRYTGLAPYGLSLIVIGSALLFSKG